MSRGKYKQAEIIIRKVAKVNRVKLPENLFLEEMTAFEELEVSFILANVFVQEVKKLYR